MNYVITTPCKTIRAWARGKLTNKWWPAIGTIMIITLCMNLVPALINLYFGVSEIFVALGDFYTLLVTGPFTLGICIYMLGITRGESVHFEEGFSGFQNFFKVLGLLIYISFFVFLWSLLFVIPGIIAALRYSMAYYIMIDHPEYTISQCVSESKKMMDGNKMKLFLLQLSFIGWGILTSVVMILIISAIIMLTPLNEIFIQSIELELSYVTLQQVMICETIALIIGVVIASPLVVYIQTTLAGFYEELRTNGIFGQMLSEKVD